MAHELIKTMLNSGECPICNAQIKSRDDLSGYYCSESDHFDLRVKLLGGEKVEVVLNGEKVSDEELVGIEW